MFSRLTSLHASLHPGLHTSALTAPRPEGATTGLQRRQLLQAMAAGGLASLPWAAARAATAANPETAATASTGDQAFRRSFAPFDGPLAAMPGQGILQTARIPLRGRLPKALRGTLYRNGAARFKLGPTQYEHWFDGDGMVQAFRFADGQASHRGVLLRTPKLLAEEAAGRFLYPAFGTPMADGQAVRSADTVNAANINLLAMHGGRELYALWEGGSAVQLDPATLAVQGFKAWSPQTQGAPFSAHPRRAPDGTVWNFGYGLHGKLIIYEIGADGQLKRQTLLDAPQSDMVHDFAITQNHLVFLLMPLALKPGMPPVGRMDRFAWQADAPMIAMLVSKADFSVKRFELPNGGVFHLGNAWEEGGVVRLGYARYAKFLEHLLALKLPDPRMSPDLMARWTEVEINLAQGTARQTDTGLLATEFPSFDVRRTGERTEFTVMMQKTRLADNAPQGPDTVLHLQGDRVQRYTYDADWIAEEHVYVPNPDATAAGKGWVLGTAFHRRTEKTTLSVFEVGQLAQGPMAQLDLPYGLPLGLHGQFVHG